MKWFTNKEINIKNIYAKKILRKKLKTKEISKLGFLTIKADIQSYESATDRNIKTIELFLDINRENIRYIEEENNVIKVAYYEKKS